MYMKVLNESRSEMEDLENIRTDVIYCVVLRTCSKLDEKHKNKQKKCDEYQLRQLKISSMSENGTGPKLEEFPEEEQK